MEVVATLVDSIMIANTSWEVVVDSVMVKFLKEFFWGKLKGELKWGVLSEGDCIGVLLSLLVSSNSSTSLYKWNLQ